MDVMKQKTVIVGNKGKEIRSDCQVTMELSESGGIQLTIDSRVQVLYGKAIRKLALEILEFFGVRHAKVLIEDSGSLDFIIAARLEAAIKKLIKTDKEYLTVFLPENKYQTEKERNRFSRLYLPGNSPKLMINAGIHHPDGIILDLEDAVAVDRKFEARFLIRNALRSLDFYGAERMVRINQLPLGLEDLEYVIPHNVNLILLPKCESADEIRQVNEKIIEIQKKQHIEGKVWLMPIIESAKGVVYCYDIAFSADNVVAMAIGLEDYTADLGTLRTEEGTESLFARTKLVVACKAAGIQAIDSVFSDVGDMEALKRTILRSKALGFNGMGCIHPRQIAVIHENYAPEALEVEKAKKIYIAFQEATEKGLGVVSLGTKMIDPPVVKRALKVIDLAIATGKLSKNWREEL
jgi:citrate lyase subunit beta / citryl-CoA lyase